MKWKKRWRRMNRWTNRKGKGSSYGRVNFYCPFLIMARYLHFFEKFTRIHFARRYEILKQHRSSFSFGYHNWCHLRYVSSFFKTKHLKFKKRDKIRIEKKKKKKNNCRWTGTRTNYDTPSFMQFSSSQLKCRLIICHLLSDIHVGSNRPSIG